MRIRYECAIFYVSLKSALPRLTCRGRAIVQTPDTVIQANDILLALCDISYESQLRGELELLSKIM